MFKIFGFLTSVASRMVFCATCSIRFSMFLSIVLCIPLYLTLSLFLAGSIDLECAPVSGRVGDCMLVSVFGIGFCVAFGDPFFCI